MNWYQTMQCSLLSFLSDLTDLERPNQIDYQRHRTHHRAKQPAQLYHILSSRPTPPHVNVIVFSWVFENRTAFFTVSATLLLKK